MPSAPGFGGVPRPFAGKRHDLVYQYGEIEPRGICQGVHAQALRRGSDQAPRRSRRAAHRRMRSEFVRA